MPEGYRHPPFDGRRRIFALGKGGLSNGAIARRPGRGPPTVSRELRRDGGGRGYRRRRAQGRAGARNGSRAVPGWRTPAWSVGSGYTTASGPAGRAAEVR